MGLAEWILAEIYLGNRFLPPITTNPHHPNRSFSSFNKAC